jgi:predicted enzyme related to lactoylglutathione lyase
MTVQKVKFMIMAQDMKRAIAFYTGAFGLQTAFETPDWTELNFGDAVVALHGGWQGGINKTGLSFQVQDINAACVKVQKAGAVIVKAPEDREGEPIYLATVRDTEGNEIMLSQRKAA